MESYMPLQHCMSMMVAFCLSLGLLVSNDYGSKSWTQLGCSHPTGLKIKPRQNRIANSNLEPGKHFFPKTFSECLGQIKMPWLPSKMPAAELTFHGRRTPKVRHHNGKGLDTGDQLCWVSSWDRICRDGILAVSLDVLTEWTKYKWRERTHEGFRS